MVGGSPLTMLVTRAHIDLCRTSSAVCPGSSHA
jgi:hypothetical protein